MVSDEIVYAVCQRFLIESNATDVVKYLQKTIPGPETDGLTREKIYPILRQGVLRGFVSLTPPENFSLATRLTDRYYQARNTDCAQDH